MQNADVQLVFNAIIGDSKEYFIKVFSEPSMYSMDLKVYKEDGTLAINSEKWVNFRRDSYGYGFFVYVTSNNVSPKGDTKERKLYIKGTLTTYPDKDYEGTASVNVNIECLQEAYIYARIRKEVGVIFEGTQDIYKKYWDINWHTEQYVSIPIGNYDVKLRDFGYEQEELIYGYEDDFVFSGNQETFSVDVMENYEWSAFTGSEYTIYKCTDTPEIIFHNSAPYIELIPEKDILEYWESGITFDIKSNIEWACEIYQKDNIENREEYSGEGDSNKTTQQLKVSGLTESRYVEYILYASGRSINDEIISDKKIIKQKFKTEANIEIIVSPTIVEADGNSIVKVDAYEVNGNNVLSKMAVECGARESIWDRTKHYFVSGDSETHLLIDNIKTTKNTGLLDRTGHLNVKVVDINGTVKEKDFTIKQNHYYVKLTHNGQKKDEYSINYDTKQFDFIVEANTDWAYALSSQTSATLTRYGSQINGAMLRLSISGNNESYIDRDFNININASDTAISNKIKDSAKVTQKQHPTYPVVVSYYVQYQELPDNWHYTVGIKDGDDRIVASEDTDWSGSGSSTRELTFNIKLIKNTYYKVFFDIPQYEGFNIETQSGHSAYFTGQTSLDFGNCGISFNESDNESGGSSGNNVTDTYYLEFGQGDYKIFGITGETSEVGKKYYYPTDSSIIIDIESEAQQIDSDLGKSTITKNGENSYTITCSGGNDMIIFDGEK